MKRTEFWPYMKRLRVLLDLGRHEHLGAGMWVYGRGIATSFFEHGYPDLDLKASYLQASESEALFSSELPSPERWLRKKSSLFGRKFSLMTDPLRYVGGIDIVHGTANTVPLRTAAKKIVTVHDLLQAYPTKRPRSFSDWIRVFYYRVYFYFLFSFVDHVICDHPDIVCEIQDRYSPKCPVEVIDLGLDPVYHDATLPEVHCADGYLLGFASSDRRKNSQAVLRAYAKLDNQQMLPLCFVASNLDVKRELLSLAEELEVSDRFQVRVGVLQSEMPRLYQDARALLFPSLAEGFGYPVYEALSQGVPVVCSEGIVPDSFSSDFEGMIVCCKPESDDSILAACNDLLGQPIDSRRRTEVARAVRERFHWSQTRERLYSLYKTI